VILGGAIGWKIYSDPAGLKAQFMASVHAMENAPELPLILLGAFFFGVIVRAVVGRDNPPRAWQDIEAWISLVALVALFIAAVIHLGIMPSLAENVNMPIWEASLGGFIAFYFGERS
jgi:hypothetical protein